MPVRTSSVVAASLVGLAALGVVTIFGGALLALTSPPEAARAPNPPAETRPSPPAGAPGTADAGAAPASVPTENPSTKGGP